MYEKLRERKAEGLFLLRHVGIILVTHCRKTRTKVCPIALSEKEW